MTTNYIAAVTRPFRRLWSTITKLGDWRVRYPNGTVTRWMSHGDAANMRSIFGGRIQARRHRRREGGS